MTQTLYLHDFACFPVLLNIVHNKLHEAQQHLKKIRVYQTQPNLTYYPVSNALAEMYAEHHDFIEHVYRQCHLWRTQTPSQEPQQLAKTAHLEKLTQRLESLTDQILYGMDCLQKRQSVSWMIQM